MPRETQSRTSSRKPVETAIGNTALIAPASTPYIVSPYTKRYSPEANELSQLADAMQHFMPGLNRMAAEEKRQRDEAEFYRGQSDAIKLGTMDNRKYAQILEEKGVDVNSPYARGAMAMAGRQSAYAAQARLQDLYIQTKQDLVTEGQFNQFLSNFAATELQGMDSPDFLKNYLGVFSDSEANLREQWKKDQLIDSRAKIHDDFSAAFRGDINGIIQQGGSAQQLNTALQAYHAQARIQGIDGSFVNEAFFEHVREAVELSGRVDLVGGEEPTNFGVFELDSADPDDPTKRIPGMANSAKWQGRIADLKERVLSASARRGGAIDEVAALYHRASIDSAIENEDFSQAQRLITEGVEKGYFKSGTGASYNKEVMKAQKHRRLVREGIKLLNANILGKPEDADPEMTPAIMKEAFHEQASSMLQHAGNDPAKQAEARAAILQMGFRRGDMFEPFKEVMTRADPGNLRSWQQGYQLYSSARAMSPTQTAQQIGDLREAQFRLYETYLMQDASPEDAQANVAQIGTQENLERVKRYLGEDRFIYEDTIEQAMVKGKAADAWFKFSQNNAVNGVAIRRDVMDYAITYLAYGQAGTGNQASAEDALKYALDMYESTHTLVSLPEEAGAQNALWVYNGGIPLPDDFTDMQQDLSQNLVQQFAGSRNAASFYYLQRDINAPFSDQFVIFNGETQRPLMTLSKDGNNIGPLKMDWRTLMDKYRGEQAAKELRPAEEVRAEQAQAVRDRLSQEQIRQTRRKRKR